MTKLATAFARAKQLHQSGCLPEAEQGYRDVLRQDPHHAGALVLLGVLLGHSGDAATGVELIRQAIAIKPNNPDYHHNLGLVCEERGRYADAEAAFRRAVELRPKFAKAHGDLGNVLWEQGRLDDAIASFQQAIVAAPKSAGGHANLGAALAAAGRQEEAIASLRKALKVDPACSKARYLLSALTGEVCLTAPLEYVADLFDSLADSYDQHLDQSDYSIPQRLRGAIVEATGRQRAEWRVIDLGCGTGRCGPLLRPFARHLCGLDVSSRMLDHARRRGVYDELIQGDLLSFLAGLKEPANLLAAADVLIYIGDLAPFLAVAHRALAPEGWLAFSTETAESGTYTLTPAGRFLHAERFLRRLAADQGFVVACCERVIGRVEKQWPVRSHVTVLRKEP